VGTPRIVCSPTEAQLLYSHGAYGVLLWLTTPSRWTETRPKTNHQTRKRCRYQDLAIHVLLEGSKDLSIIGEVQMHVRDFLSLKNHMHKLYKIKRD